MAESAPDPAVDSGSGKAPVDGSVDVREAGRRSFRRTTLAGIPLAALATVACAKPWIGGGTTGGGDASLTALDQGTRYPAASAVSLVLLAAWGVVLVTRGVVRRAFALLVAIASVGLVTLVVAGYLTLPDSAGSSFDELMGRSRPDTGFTGWFWTAAVASVLAVPPALSAVRRVRGWPEMGRRYDAPTPGSSTRGAAASAEGGATAPRPAETERDLWEQLDEGHDPTDTTPRH